MKKMFSYQIFLDPPADFSPSMEAAGCYCSYKDKILLVKRQPFKSQGNKWGVPAGKLEKDEDPTRAVIRELKEEVGLTLTVETLQEMGTLFIRLPTQDYIYHMYFTQFSSLPEVVLDLSENQEARWTTLKSALKLPLVAAGKEALAYYQNFCTPEKRLCN